MAQRISVFLSRGKNVEKKAEPLGALFVRGCGAIAEYCSADKLLDLVDLRG
jgi:hypothetical protein